MARARDGKERVAAVAWGRAVREKARGMAGVAMAVQVAAVAPAASQAMGAVAEAQAEGRAEVA